MDFSAHRHTRREIAAVLATFPFFIPTSARGRRQSEELSGELDRDGAPCVAFGIVRHGREVVVGGSGLVTSRKQRPDGKTIFEIGSLTKTFTASLIFQLQEEHRLKIDAPIAAYVSGLPEAWRPLLLSELLSHTSGLPEYLNQDNFRQVMPKDLTPREIVALVADRPMQFAAGTARTYNNTGFILLGMAAEAITGKSFWDELQHRFFGPAGMASTGPRSRVDHRNRYADGHFWDGTRFDNDPPQTAPGSTFSAGGLVSCAEDMDLWSIALDRGRLLSAEIRRQMWRQAHLRNGEPAGWGYGWQIETRDGRTIVSHGGGTAGFSCWYQRDLSVPLSTIVMTDQNGRADPQAITNNLLARVQQKKD